MGLFDGDLGSAASLAKTLELPVVLVVDVRSAAESVAAVVKGFDTLDPELRVAAVVANRIGSERHGEMVAAAIRSHCRPEVLGLVPRRAEVAIPSRHLGLHMGEEQPLSAGGLDQLARLAEDHLDLDRLLALAADRQPVTDAFPAVAASEGGPVRIGVARDAAFCFYYEDNLDLSRAAGADTVFFSPLADRDLPPIWAGSTWAAATRNCTANASLPSTSLRAAIRAFAGSGRPVPSRVRRLHGADPRTLHIDLEGQEHRRDQHLSLPGADAAAARQPRLPAADADPRHLAPRRPGRHRARRPRIPLLTLEGELPQPPPSASTTAGPRGLPARKRARGYVHLHWGRTPEVAARFVRACLERGAGGRRPPLSGRTAVAFRSQVCSGHEPPARQRIRQAHRPSRAGGHAVRSPPQGEPPETTAF